MTLKINRQGAVSDSAAVTPDPAVLEGKPEAAEAEIAELEAGQPAPAPAVVTETAPEPVADPPAAPRPPRVPPRRTPPPGAAGG